MFNEKSKKMSMETLCKIRTIYKAVTSFENEMESMYHLGLNEGMLLCSLSSSERMSSGEIADVLGLTPSNTSKVIRSVEMKGMIERVLGEVDKRQMYFSLTEKGKIVLADIRCDNIKVPDLLCDILKKVD